MSETNENKIDMEVLEKTVTEATGSLAIGQFVKQTLAAALQLRSALIREQTSNAMRHHQANGRRECPPERRSAGRRTLTTPHG